MSAFISAQKHSFKPSEIITFFITSLLGVFSHFVYEWTGNNSFIGLFFPINESTWEHLKLIYFPIMIVSLLEYYFGNTKRSDFICIKFRSAVLGMFLTVTLFYTYSGVLGMVVDWVNILIYFISVAIAYLYSHKKINSNTLMPCNPHLNLLFTFTTTALFMIFTVYPPDLGLFKVP